MFKKKIYFSFMIFIALLFILSACMPKVTPPESKKPQIPAKISRGPDKEPVLSVYIKETGEKKEMPFEEYIAGVVAGEMKNDWPLEALAAQAILARTFVMEFISTKGGSKYGTDVSTDVEEVQAYDEKSINDRVRKAVEMTRGQVILYKGEYVKAWFHSHSGGKTALPSEGLEYKGGDPPYIKVVDSPDSPKSPADVKSWTAVFPKAKVIAAIKKLGKDISDFKSVSIGQKGPSGRAISIKFDGVEVPAPELRLELGKDIMKSTLIDDIRISGNNLIIKGKGFGHGVGMSQWGAYALAEQGKKADEIIKYYFKDVDIITMWK